LPFIEFDRPAFPWLFTPAAPDADECLRPWIVLVVVRKAAARLTVDPRRPLPALECPVSELPDLEESWAWVHAQYTGSQTSREDLQDSEEKGALSSRPQQTVSRLLCPRQLQARRGGDVPSYYACLVPAFEAGRKAGLGESLTDDDEELKAAWNLTATGQVTLPVYYHWEFSTAEEGDFEDLIDRLQFLQSLPAGELRRMDVRQPGGGMLPLPYQKATLGIASALQTPGDQPQDWSSEPSSDFTSFQEDLQEVLEAPDRATTATTPTVAPPIYGRWHVHTNEETGTPAGSPSLAPGAAPAWLRDLNLDPRYRVAAALGTQVVQQQQEYLVTAAWEQVAQLNAVNQWLRQKQLAREVTTAIYQKRLQGLSRDAFWQITAPVAAVTSAPERPTQEPQSPQTLMHNAAVSAPFRRIARPFGALARPVAEMGAAAASGVMAAAAAPSAGLSGLTGLLERISAGLIQVAPPPGAISGAVMTADYAPQLATAALAGEADAITTGAADSPAEAEARAELLQRLEPLATFKHEAETRIVLSQGMESLSSRSDVLQPINVVPNFPQPMYEPLRELFQDMLLPGLERIPNNSITLLETNPKFIEAYMLGLNHELSRELLWREFPTDLRGTYFRQFWDVRGRPPSATAAEPEESADIPEIREWQAALGSNMPAESGTNLVMLLIRGDLLTRYPTALIYAARATWSTTKSGQTPPVIDSDQSPQFPVLRVNPAPGVTLLRFTLDPSPRLSAPDSWGDPGWFFVIEEHPTETRFGLDLSRELPTLTSWRELTWQDVDTRDDDSGYISVATSAPMLPDTAPEQDKNVVWGRNGAHMAYIIMQKPYRLQIHSSFWFGYTSEGLPGEGL
jgi:hypothetical protein